MNSGVAAQMDLDGIVENEFWNVEKDVEDSRRYFFNQPTAARDAWLTHPEADRLSSHAPLPARKRTGWRPSRPTRSRSRPRTPMAAVSPVR